MPRVPVPANETQRLRALNDCGILDTADEELFDDLVRLAAELTGTPMAAIGLVDAHRLWLKSVVGLSDREFPRDVSICAYAILPPHLPLIIPDTCRDERTKENPLVTGPAGLRFYAGVPLVTGDGYGLGALCVLDRQPRELTAKQLSSLESLARHATAQLELRRTNRELIEEQRARLASQERFARIAAQIPGVVYQFKMLPDGTMSFPYVSEGMQDLFQIPLEEIYQNANVVLDALHPDDLDSVLASTEVSSRLLTPWRQEFRICRMDGEVRWVCGHSTPVRQADQSILWHGFLSDITGQRAEHLESQRLRGQLQAIIDGSPETAIVATDTQGVVNLFNRGAELLLGFSASEVIGTKRLDEFHLPCEIARREQDLSRETGRRVSGFDTLVEYARVGRHESREWTLIRKDGSLLTAKICVTGLRDPSQGLTGFVAVANDITAVRVTEQQLRRERERLSLALAAGEVGTWEWDVTTGIAEHDAQFASIIGWPGDSFNVHIDDWARDHCHPEDVMGVREALNSHMSGRTPTYQARFRMRHANGQWIWLESCGRVTQRDSRGRPLKLVGTNKDVSAQVRAEEAFRESESRFRALAAFAPVGIFQTDENGLRVYTNRRCEEINGRPEEDLMGERWLNAIAHDDRDRVRQQWQRGVAAKADLEMGYHICQPTGEIRLVKMRATPVFTDDKSLLGYIGVTEDVTQRTRAEEAQRQSESRFRSLAAFAPVGIFQADSNGKMEYVNCSGLGIVGRHDREISGLKWPRVIAREDRQAVMRDLRQAIASRQPFELGFRIQRPDQSIRSVQAKGCPLTTPAGKLTGCVGILEDVTESKAFLSELIAARETAESASRVKSEFLANMSHEIRTPLTSILGYAELLADPTITEEERLTFATTVQRSGEHLLNVINDVLDLSKIESGKMLVDRRRCRPVDIAREVLATFQESVAAKSLRLTAANDGWIPETIETDPHRLRQILINLVGNAVKFTERGGIDLCLKLLAAQGTPGQQLPQLAFAIRDTGIGIAPADQSVLFSPFIQVENGTTRNRPGTGLGLAISRRIARLLGGDIELHSTLGVGSTFTLTIACGPLDGIRMIERLDLEEWTPPALVVPEIPLSGRALIVEDSEEISRLMRLMLMRAGMSVDVVTTGPAAVDRACPIIVGEIGDEIAATAPYDLLLLDLQLPLMSGQDAARAIRARGYAGPIIAVTANVTFDIHRESILAGCNAFVAKPINRERLLTVCREWLDRRRDPTDDPQISLHGTQLIARN